jgi:hypothetical protein
MLKKGHGSSSLCCVWKVYHSYENHPVIGEEIPAKVATENADKETTRLEHDCALQRVIIDLLADHTDLFKLFSDDESFKEVVVGIGVWDDLGKCRKGKTA